jgi:photosystem II stability/assembly factor-like uncharacterized protein
MGKVKLILAIALLAACGEDENMHTSNGKSSLTIEIIDGDNQTVSFNTPLENSLLVKVTRNEREAVKDAWITFVPNDNSANSYTLVKTDAEGLAYIDWTAGCEAGDNHVQVVLLDSISARIDSVQFTAHVQPPTGWGKSCGSRYETVSMALHPNGDLYAFQNGNKRITRSRDKGVSWSEVITFPAQTSLSDAKIAIDNMGNIITATAVGILLSSDDGSSWVWRDNGITNVEYPQDLTATDNGDLFYSSYFGGLYRSQNKGLSWTSIMTGLSFNDRFYHLSKLPDGTLFVVNDLGNVYKSVDNGEKWTYIKFQPTYNVSSLFIDGDGTMYIGATNSNAELYKSSDKGLNWQLVTTVPDDAGCYDEIKTIKKRFNDVYFYSGCVGLFKCSNGNCVGVDNDHTSVFGQFELTSAHEIAVGSGDGIWYNFHF